MNFRKILLPGLVLMIIFISSQAQAAPLNSSGLLDDILNRFSEVAHNWSTDIESYAKWLFWTLVLISMVWTFVMMALQGEGISGALAEIVRFFAVTGFFFYLLDNGPAMSISIQDSLRQLAAKASGMPSGLSPSGIVDIGFDIAGRAADQSSVWTPADSTVGLLIAAVILCVLALVGVNMLLLLISGWILSFGGIILLGFGGSKWTSDIAINYFKTVLGLALQLFTMVLIVGIGKSFIDQYYQAMGSDALQVKTMFVMLVASIVLLVLVNKVPPMIGSIPGGASMGGIGGFGAGALIGAAAAAGAAIATAGAAAAAGATSAAGGMSALQAAYESANAAESGSGGGSGGGSGSSGGEDTGNADNAGPAGGGGSDGGGSGGGSSKGGSSGFASSFSKAGRMMSHMANSLSSGAVAHGSSVANSKMQSARDAIAQTTGGQIASQIRSQTAERMSGGESAGQDTGSTTSQAAQEGATNENSNSTDSFSGDSLSGSQSNSDTGNVQDTQDEFEKFKNKQAF
ncbi:P-type conjugative transfer protein TrbL [Pantoea agglomerans]|uniref:P-type conjugative transfer protein TrbL n=1 Tax=Enterobacter agglomerans TaxID=549 RepID=UPI003C7AA69B